MGKSIEPCKRPLALDRREYGGVLSRSFKKKKGSSRHRRRDRFRETLKKSARGPKDAKEEWLASALAKAKKNSKRLNQGSLEVSGKEWEEEGDRKSRRFLGRPEKSFRKELGLWFNEGVGRQEEGALEWAHCEKDRKVREMYRKKRREDE